MIKVILFVILAIVGPPAGAAYLVEEGKHFWIYWPAITWLWIVLLGFIGMLTDS